jgi:regulator of protease activity HflC (stomatin/prohibitin superfamily)
MELVYLLLAALFGIIFVSSTFKVLANWERAVILRLGKFNRMTGPGPIFLLPFGIDRAYRVDTRIVTLDVPRQDMMTRDNVPVSVDAIVLFNVTDPRAAILNIENFMRTTSLIAQTTLRSTIGQCELDELLAQRERINQTLQAVIDEQTEPYGVKVTAVEVRDVSLPETMKRAMAAQAEAERDKRAKVINAEGEFQAAERLTQAANMMSKEPAALQLRYLQSMREIASERSSMTILPIPIDLLTPFVEMAKRANEQAKEAASETPAPATTPPLAATPETPSLNAAGNGDTAPALSAYSATAQHEPAPRS